MERSWAKGRGPGDSLRKADQRYTSVLNPTVKPKSPADWWHWHCTVFSSIRSTKTSLVMILCLLALSMTLCQILHCFVAPHQRLSAWKKVFWYRVLYFNVMRIYVPRSHVPQSLCSPVPVGYLWVILIPLSNPHLQPSTHNPLDPQPLHPQSPRPTTTKYYFIPLDGINQIFLFQVIYNGRDPSSSEGKSTRPTSIYV